MFILQVHQPPGISCNVLIRRHFADYMISDIVYNNLYIFYPDIKLASVDFISIFYHSFCYQNMYQARAYCMLIHRIKIGFFNENISKCMNIWVSHELFGRRPCGILFSASPTLAEWFKIAFNVKILKKKKTNIHSQKNTLLRFRRKFDQR